MLDFVDPVSFCWFVEVGRLFVVLYCNVMLRLCFIAWCMLGSYFVGLCCILWVVLIDFGVP